MKNFNSIGITALLLCILLASCNNQSLRIFKSSSARTQYLHTLKTSGIADTKIGTEWQNSASKAVLNAAVLEIPVAIQGNFLAKSIEANAWKIQLDQGASVNIWVDWQARDSSELIVDLLAGPDWKELESFAAREDSVTFEADKAGNYILRIQPELLGEGNFQVRVQGTATYAVFPVQGRNSRAIQSIWGDVRDGGRRSHEGVDIFAPRGTPVLAPVAGVVTSVRDQGLGGKQVWVRDGERNWHLYFAHLDSQLVSSLQRVAPGDTLGLVGNTGNARTTAPHLHFGIYQNGAINPFPAIENDFDTAPELTPRELDRVMTVTAPKANLRGAPSTRADVVTQLTDQTPVFILAATRDWYQIHTADGLRGFLSMSLVGEADSASLPKSEAVALTNLDPLTQDALLVQLDEFVKIGSIRGYDLIRDADENILYLPTEGN
ncbi:M23 family metallopeptidase [Algoriphagus terrigena]|uniref:M23 family metallopeptidase n=1 Tax=Algoriphagus terrigena TaxID=344884 RepID=UPI00047BD780|nr:M23 family metallopeptidase [Algoriphagus terrigena]